MGVCVRMILGIILSLFWVVTYSQPNNIRRTPPPKATSEADFRAIVRQTKASDSLLELYSAYALNNLRSSPQSTLQIINEVKKLDGISELKKKAYYTFLMAQYWYNPKPDSSIYYSELAVKSFKRLEDYDKVLVLITLQARSFARLNEYLKAEEKYFDALEFYKENGSGLYKESTIINELTDIYIRVGAIDIALDRYKELLKNESFSENEECRIRLKMSNAYKRNLELDKAKEELTPCENLAGIGIPLKVSILKSISDIEKILGNTEARIKPLEQAVKLQQNNPYQDFTSYLFLAEAYFDGKYFSRSDSIISILDDFNMSRVQPPARASYLLFKSKNSLQNKNYNQAINYADQAISFLERLPSSSLKIDASVLKAEALEKKGDYKSAYEITKSLSEMERLLGERGRVKEEEISKVRFQMRAKNQELVQISTELGYVKIRNALVILFLILLTGYILYRARINSLLKIERTRNKIAQDLHDDLSATLSSISFFSEAAKRDTSSLNLSKFLNRIEESASEAKEKINDIIWAIDPENDDWELFTTKCKRYAAEMFETRDIEYEINMTGNITSGIDVQFRQDLWLIFKEVITNIVRHSDATKAKIETVKSGKTLTIIFSDNGIGFNSLITPNGNGISNINRRCEIIGAKVKLTSKKGEGTKWVFNFVN